MSHGPSVHYEETEVEKNEERLEKLLRFSAEKSPSLGEKKVSCLFYQYNNGGMNLATQLSFVEL